ncbi:MAG: ATP-binding cassette domain-containing protein, partial [Chloroflexi bacterium]|nr:ATP-binding cassette domain-containing protein [Chloroflexota bacterium]
MIHARGLGIRFGSQWALAHVDLELESGDRLLLAGANGSGKTTLLRLIAGLRQPAAGE